MKIEKKTREVKKEIDYQTAVYTKKDLEALVKKDLAAKGYDTTDAKLTFDIDTKTVTDEWGMHPRRVLTVNNVSMTVKEKEQ